MNKKKMGEFKTQFFFPDGPIFKSKPKSVEADIDSMISLSCDVDGNPQPDILWIHEGNDRVSVMH